MSSERYNNQRFTSQYSEKPKHMGPWAVLAQHMLPSGAVLAALITIIFLLWFLTTMN